MLGPGDPEQERDAGINRTGVGQEGVGGEEGLGGPGVPTHG